MDAEQALRGLTELSSQITAAVVFDAQGAVLATSAEDTAASPRLTTAALELVAAAADLGSGTREVTRVEVELAEGAIFVIRDGGHTVAATTGPNPTAGLVVYDLRTCAQSIDAPAPKPKRTRKPKADEA
jgi:predicted regulator of Ras-like GTPase activity (Roadblock/LC7/MglB family)